MQPDEAQAREEAAWRTFLQHLGRQLEDEWPALRERLADRYEAFVEHAAQQALQRGIDHAAGIARWVNLCVVWGPSFHERPGFEWAHGLLAGTTPMPPARAWLSVHQLLRRSLVELERRPQARIEAATLAAVDARLLDRFATAGRAGAMARPADEPLPRAACDLEAAELRVPDGPPMQGYELTAGEWQRLSLPPPAPVRAALTHPAPALVGLLSPPRGQGPATRLQARLRSHAVCDADHHPLLTFAGTHGLWQWHGPETRAVSWPVATLEQPAPAAGAGSAIAEETSPEIYRLELQTCGLRDEGDALGSVQLPVWAWPATQWWAEVQRQAAPAQPVRAGAGDALRGRTRCRVEADGQAQDAQSLERAFAEGLDTALERAQQTLLQAWQAVPGLNDAGLEGLLAMLVGRAALSWGWRLGTQGLGARALMRVRGQLEMSACRVELGFAGTLEEGGAKARATLAIAGDLPLSHDIRRETDAAPLLETVLPLVTRFSLPVLATLEPLASDNGALLQADGPATGQLVGEAGLRPRTRGGSGWEWFAGLRLEPVALPVRVTDPFVGDSARTLPLLPALALVDWSLG